MLLHDVRVVAQVALVALGLLASGAAGAPRVVALHCADAATRCALEPLAAKTGTAVRLRCTSARERAETEACAEAEIELPAPAGVSFVVEAAAQVSGAAPGSGYLAWRSAGDGAIRVRVPLDTRAPVVDVRVVPGAPVRAAEYTMYAEPADPAPLGSRTPVFLAHGFSSEHSLLPFDPLRNDDFGKFRALPEYRASFGAFKYYYFTYRPWADYREVGAGMAAEMAKVLATAPAATRALVVGRSGGALPARYAANDPALAPRVMGIVTLDGAMRGSVGASLLHSDGRVAKRVGIPAYLMLKLTQRTYPFSPMVDSLTFDDFDGTIGDGAAKYGVMANDHLREFNAGAQDAGKLVAYMGDVKNLLGWGDYGVKDEVYRRVLAAYDPSWGSADPLVHRPSGTLEGKPVRLVRLLPGRHHSEVLTDPALMRMILLDLYQLAQVGRFAALWTAPLSAP